MARGWIALLRSLGEAFVEVLTAEAEAFKEDIASSGRNLGMAVALAGLVAVLVFWAVGTAAFVVFQILLLWLSAWVSALIVLGLLLVLALAIGALARRRLHRVETPVATARRRLADHQQWWQERLLAESSESPPASLRGDQSQSEGPESSRES